MNNKARLFLWAVVGILLFIVVPIVLDMKNLFLYNYLCEVD